MGYKFGERSLGRLEGVDPRLVKVFQRAIEISEVDFTILEGVRSRETCMVYYGKGRTAAELALKNIPAKYAQPKLAKVTWLKNPFNSKHCKQPDGFGKAVDAAPWPIDWNDLKRFDKMAEAILKAAEELGISIRWGADWDKDGKPRERGESDSPHFELD